MFFTLILCAVLSLIIGYFLYRNLFLSTVLDQLPSPQGIPLVGNAFQIPADAPHQKLHEWTEKFGGLFVFRIFGKPHIVVSSKEALLEILVKRGSDYAGRPYMYRGDFAYGGCKNVAFQTANNVWKLQRKVAHAAMKQYGDGLQRIESISISCLQEAVERLSNFKGKPQNPRQILKETFTNVIFTMILGKTISADDPMLKKVMHMVQKYCDGMAVVGDGLLLDILPFLRFFGNTSYKTLCEARDISDELWGIYLDKLKESAVEGKERGVADHLILAQKKYRTCEGDPILTDEHIAFTLTDLLNGGAVSSTETLYGFFNILLHYPTIQDKLHDEISSVMKSNPDGMMSLSDRARMPYTTAVLLELLRYTSVASIGLPHETICDTEVLGHKVPKGTTVIPNFWWAHHNPKQWPEPWTFNPDRFLDENGALLPPEHQTRKGFMPFGAGKRGCLAESFTKSRLFLAICIFVSSFHFTAPNPEALTPCDPRTYIFGGMLSPRDYNVCMTPRTQNI